MKKESYTLVVLRSVPSMYLNIVSGERLAALQGHLFCWWGAFLEIVSLTWVEICLPVSVVCSRAGKSISSPLGVVRAAL